MGIISGVLALAILVSGSSMPLVYASGVTADPGFGCGNRQWGVTNYHNDETNQASFGKAWDCIGNLTAYKSRQNVVKLHTAVTSTHTAPWISWQAAIEGCSPWGTCDTGGAGHPEVTIPSHYHNSIFDRPNSLATQNLSLHGQWVWSNDARPASSSSNVEAHYLTDIWLVHKTNNKRVVIDFMWTKLVNSGGFWAQQTNIFDVDPVAIGTQYSPLTCEKDGSGLDTYHYNVVLDSTTHNPDTWADKTANISAYITDAISRTYSNSGQGPNCSSNTPGGSKSNYDLVDIESGIELQVNNSISTGAVTGGYSMTDLYY